MTCAHAPAPRPVSEPAREREVYTYYQPDVDTPDLGLLLDHDPDGFPGFVPRFSKDAALMGLAQLGAMRLNATRALISLIDGRNQYVLAEATHDMCLRSDPRHQLSAPLWLGNVVIPRNMAICEHALTCDSDEQDPNSALIVNDVAADERFRQHSIIKPAASARFYAGVPIRSPKGANIGAFAIVDDQPRDGLSPESLHLLHDMAAAVMDYLETYKIREENKRADQMIRGLTSFVTGSSSLQSRKERNPHQRPRRHHAPRFSRRESSESHVFARDMDDRKAIGPSPPRLSPPEPSPPEDDRKAIQPSPPLLSPPEPSPPPDDRKAIQHSPPPLSPPEPSPSPDDRKAIQPSPPLLSPPEPSPPQEDMRSAQPSPVQENTPDPITIAGTIPPQERSDKSIYLRPSLKSTESSLTTEGRGPTLQETMLPLDSKMMFSRAASIIRETTDLEGVLMFDAAIGSHGGDRRDSHRRNTSRPASLASVGRSSGSDEPSPSPSGDSTKQSSDSESPRPPRRKLSEILAFSTQQGSSLHGDTADECFETYAEADLHRLLRRYPNGKIFNVTATGAASSTEESDLESRADFTVEDLDGTRRRKPTAKDREVQKILRIAPRARSIVFVPLWEYQRERWFAGCLLWTTDPLRILCSNELLFYRTFGNSIMTELSRLDAIASDRAKTTFVSSISHELRSPLHGILGGVEFLQDTSVDAFQAGMIHSIEMCGRTLLDTVEHILDYSKINKFANHRAPDKPGPRDSRHLWLKERSRSRSSPFQGLTNPVDLGAITEEVVEACLAGQSYKIRGFSSDMFEEGKSRMRSLSASSRASGGLPDRKNIRVILDIPYRPSWIFSTQAGSWRRVLLNIFGNAVKYTQSGFIHVRVQCQDPDPDDEGAETKVSLIVSDSGIGIHPEYLHNRLYTPFSQEDSFAAGTGLGLSIVRQIVDSLGGKINFKSQLGVGTDVKVNLKFPAIRQADDAESSFDNANDLFQPVKDRLKDLKLCIFEPIPPPEIHDGDAEAGGEIESSSKGQLKTSTSLAKVLSEWFGVKLLVGDPHSADIVICTEPSFAFLEQTRAARSEAVPLVVFIALDAVEAVTLRGDSRVTSPVSIVEIITQPCGPHKLAKTLNRCLNRSETGAGGPQGGYLHDLERLQQEHPNGSEYAPSPTTGPVGEDQDEKQPETPPAPAGETENENDPDSPVSPRTTRTRASNNKLGIRINTRPLRSEAQDSATPSPTDSSGRPLRILMVDDNAINMRLLSAFMKKHALACAQASNGVQALELYKAERGRFDYVLMDLSMPVMDGMTATREIRRLERRNGWRGTCVVALTGLASATARGEALSAGIDHFMTKPVRFGALLGILRGEEG